MKEFLLIVAIVILMNTKKQISKDHYYGITNDGHSYSSYTKYVKNTFNARNVINFPGRW